MRLLDHMLALFLFYFFLFVFLFVFLFWGTSHTVLQSGCSNLHSHLTTFSCVFLVSIPYCIVVAQFWFSYQQVTLPVELCYKVYWWHCGIRLSDCSGSFRIYCEILWNVWISSPSVANLRLVIQTLQWEPLDSFRIEFSQMCHWFLLHSCEHNTVPAVTSVC